jgi:hypothetical protein
VEMSQVGIVSTVRVNKTEKKIVCGADCSIQSKLGVFSKGLHMHPAPKMAGAPQPGFLLCLPMTAVSFHTQLNSILFLFL